MNSALALSLPPCLPHSPVSEPWQARGSKGTEGKGWGMGGDGGPREKVSKWASYVGEDIQIVFVKIKLWSYGCGKHEDILEVGCSSWRLRLNLTLA